MIINFNYTRQRFKKTRILRFRIILKKWWIAPLAMPARPARTQNTCCRLIGFCQSDWATATAILVTSLVQTPSYSMWPEATYMSVCTLHTHAKTPAAVRVTHGPLKLRTKHGGDNSRSLWRNGFQAKCFSRIQRRCSIMHTHKILAQLLSSPRSYSLPKSTTYTVVKSQFLGLQLSRQITRVKI
jgi:hypothetical protein